MSRPDTSAPSRNPADPLRLLEPLRLAGSATACPSTLVIGICSGTIAGSLVGLALGLSFVRSPVAVAVIPATALLLMILWPLALGAIAMITGRRADGQETGLKRALIDTSRKIPALVLTALPVLMTLGALIAIQISIFALTRAPEGDIVTPRPVILIAIIFVALLVFDVIAFAGANVFLWLVVPHVALANLKAGAALREAHSQFWERPGWCIGSMLSVLTLSGTVTGTWVGFLFIAMMATSTTQLLGSNEIILLRFSEPLLQDSFAVPTGNLVAVAFMTAGIGGAIGAAVGLGQIFGMAGGTGLLRIQDRSTR